jgi:hypothetical protein
VGYALNYNRLDFSEEEADDAFGLTWELQLYFIKD